MNPRDILAEAPVDALTWVLHQSMHPEDLQVPLPNGCGLSCAVVARDLIERGYVLAALSEKGWTLAPEGLERESVALLPDEDAPLLERARRALVYVRRHDREDLCWCSQRPLPTDPHTGDCAYANRVYSALTTDTGRNPE